MDLISVFPPLRSISTQLHKMGRQTKPRKSASYVVGKGPVNPMQVAYIVDQYLADNNFAGTRSLFRSEASSLLGKSKDCEPPKRLLSLSALLNEYVCLKEQKLVMDHNMYQFELYRATANSELQKEKAMVEEAKSRVEQEKAKLDLFLEEFQGQVNSYKSPAAPSCLTPPPSKTSIVPPTPLESKALPPSDNIVIQTPTTAPASIVPNHNTRKRKIYKAVPDKPEPSKKACGSTPTGLLSSPGNISTGQQQDENLFSKPSSGSPNSNAPCLQTPQRSVSYSRGKSISPPGDLSSSEKTPNNCTIYSSQTIILTSPTKRFSIERKHCTYTSPSTSNMGKRDHVKSRLDFDAADLPNTSEKLSLDVCTTSESDMDGDIFDMDLDALGPNFSLAELLNDCVTDWEVSHPCQDAIAASPSEPREGDFCVSQEPEQSIPKGTDPVSVKSITQCIQVVSPVKEGKPPSPA